MFTFLVFPLILVGSPIIGMLLTAVICIANPCKLSNAEGTEPIFYVAMIAGIAVFALLFLAAGAWMALPVFAFLIGVVVGLPLCFKYAPYLDDIKAFLWTPQQPGKRKETVPCYPKSEPIPVPVEEELMMMYYSRD